MPDYISDTVEPRSVFVGFFDILGFKNLRDALGTHRLYKLFDRNLLSSIQHAAAGQGKIENRDGTDYWVPDVNETSLQFQIFSDNVVMFTPDDSVSSLLNLIRSSHELLQYGLPAKLPFRGAIGHGDFIHDPRGIFLGEALEDAYLHESAQAWSGVSLTPRCAKFVDDNDFVGKIDGFFDEVAKRPLTETQQSNLAENRRRLVQYDVPMQSNPKNGPVTYGTVRTYAIDWTIRMFDGAMEKAIPESTNPHAKAMRENSIEFGRWAKLHNR